MCRWLFFIGFIVSNSTIWGQQIIEINDLVDERNFMPYEVTYFIDSTNKVTFNDISSGSYADRFQQNSLYQNKDFKINASYWIRLPIRHSVKSKKIWLLEFYDQTIDYFDAFVPQENGSYKKISMGDELPFTQRTLMHKNFEIILEMKSDTLMRWRIQKIT
ncbi:MAG: 7TM-DISM domain-containing protein [Cyclobacteriaceae bacterium]